MISLAKLVRQVSESTQLRFSFLDERVRLTVERCCSLVTPLRLSYPEHNLHLLTASADMLGLTAVRRTKRRVGNVLEAELNSGDPEVATTNHAEVTRTIGCIVTVDEMPPLLQRLGADSSLVLGAVWLLDDDGSAIAEIHERHPQARTCSDLAAFVAAYCEFDLVLITDHDDVITREVALVLIELALIYDARLAAFEGVSPHVPRYSEIWRMCAFVESSRKDILARPPDPEAIERLIRLIDQRGRGRWMKRVFDVLLSAPVLVFVFPLMVLIGFAVRLDSPGPGLFVQERLGYRRRPFWVLKFRTMHQNASSLPSHEPGITEKDDPRITRFGRFLRKSRLDELPQLINVVKGDMSIVGPRPIREFRADELAARIPFYNVRFTEKPGLTGRAQVDYKYPFLDLEHVIKFKYEFKYIKERGFIADLKLVFKTFLVLIYLKGA